MRFLRCGPHSWSSLTPMLIHFAFSYVQELVEDTVYKINIYAIVEECSDVQIESKELHEKVCPFQIECRGLFSICCRSSSWVVPSTCSQKKLVGAAKYQFCEKNNCKVGLWIFLFAHLKLSKNLLFKSKNQLSSFAFMFKYLAFGMLYNLSIACCWYLSCVS